MTQAFDFHVANFPEFSCGGQIPVPGKYRIDELRPIWVKASFGVQNISRISPKYQTAISRSYNSNHGPKVILRLERAGKIARGTGGPTGVLEAASWRLGDSVIIHFEFFASKKTGWAPPRGAPHHFAKHTSRIPACPSNMQAVSMRAQAPTFVSGVAPAKFGELSVARFRFLFGIPPQSPRFGPSE